MAAEEHNGARGAARDEMRAQLGSRGCRQYPGQRLPQGTCMGFMTARRASSCSVVRAPGSPDRWRSSRNTSTCAKTGPASSAGAGAAPSSASACSAAVGPMKSWKRLIARCDASSRRRSGRPAPVAWK